MTQMFGLVSKSQQAFTKKLSEKILSENSGSESDSKEVYVNDISTLLVQEIIDSNAVYD